jgi:hypothetical protein
LPSEDPVGPLEELAATAGYQVQSSGKLPLLRYVVAIRPGESGWTMTSGDPASKVEGRPG